MSTKVEADSAAALQVVVNSGKKKDLVRVTVPVAVNLKSCLLLIGIAVIVLGLVLGLGLGLGLRRHSDALQNTEPELSWRRDSEEYVLSNDFDTKAPDTTREYTLTLTEIPNGAPDGVSRRLLLINGAFPGPVIEANEGDSLVVHVNNMMTIPSAIHWHGQYQNGTIISPQIIRCLIQGQITWTVHMVYLNAPSCPMLRSHTTLHCSNPGHIGTTHIPRQPTRTVYSDL
jgi:hypothetical protein